MSKPLVAIFALLALAPRPAAAADAPELTAQQILDQVLALDPWGLSHGEVKARAVMIDKRGSQSSIAFVARSRRHDPPLAKTLVRFSAPEDLAGAGFLQIQHRDRDDDRYLYLPELKASRRISGNLRSSSFMGTDFSFADLDRRDLRTGTATLLPPVSLGKHDCYRIDVTPGDGSVYSKISLWVRKEDSLPVKWEWSDKAGLHAKTLTALEVKRVSGRSYITRSSMVNLREKHSTELVLDALDPAVDIPEDELTSSRLEKLQ
jgi:hypothetical protein